MKSACLGSHIADDLSIIAIRKLKWMEWYLKGWYICFANLISLFSGIDK
jgi:hypothetical protein